jgi:hypothetical protein
VACNSVVEPLSTKIDPPWIRRRNQRVLLRPPPPFELLLARDRLVNITVVFAIHEVDAMVALGKRTGLLARSMLPNPDPQIVRDANVQGGSGVIGYDVNPIIVIAVAQGGELEILRQAQDDILEA